MAEVQTTFTSDDSAIKAAYDRQQKALIALEERLAKIAASTKEVNREQMAQAREQQRIAELGKRIWEETRTPQEAHQARVQNLRRMYTAGAIDMDTYGRAVRKSSEALRAQEHQLSGAAAAAEKLKREQEKLAADGQRVYEATRTPLERYASKLSDLRRLLSVGAIDQETFGRAAKHASEQLDQQQRSLSSVISGIGKMAAGYLTASTALRVHNELLERKKQLETEASQAHVSLSDARAAAIRMLGPVEEKDVEAADARIKQISAETGVDMRDLYRAAGNAWSARGDMSQMAALDSVHTAARLISNPSSEAERTSVSGAILDIQKKTGLANATDAAGFVQAMGSAARVTNMDFLSKNVITKTLAVMNAGDSLREAGALTAGLSQAMGDQTGAVSGTLAAKLSADLAEFAPDQDRFVMKGNRKVLAAKGTGLKTTQQRLKALQDNPALRLKFLSQYNYEAGSEPYVQDLVSGGNAAAQVRAAYAALPEPEQAGVYAERVIRNQQIGASAQIGRAHQRIQQAQDALALEDPALAAASKARDVVESYIKRADTGTYYTTRLKQHLGFDNAALAEGLNKKFHNEAVTRPGLTPAVLDKFDIMIDELRKLNGAAQQPRPAVVEDLRER